MKKIFVLLALLSLIFVVGCAAAKTSGDRSALGVAPVPQPAMPPEANSRQQVDGDVTVTGEMQKAQGAAITDRMIVYNAQLNLEVQDADKAAVDIAAIAVQFKGYVAGTNLSRDGKGQMRGTVTLRIPAESLDAVQKQIEAVGLKVLSRNKSSNDVTDQYTDLNARLTNLTATEADLRKLMDRTTERATKADDILAIYRELTNVRTQIEQIKGQMNVLEKTSTLATLTISLQPRQEVQVLEPDTWLPNRTAAEALKALVQAMQGLADLTIWVLLFLVPVIIVLLIPIVVLALIARALLRRRTKRTIATT
ncbi:MAG: DUF4349 domain-containing protein [Chloroflexi bacterium]|nr:DUF4349 domain-containing protein [Chloroflexota bacterium]